ncbi:MAG: site-specific integrase [Sedimentisphaerales bacterium]|nr:site-specific integrase [Sedimentisphaerales bacterium]
MAAVYKKKYPIPMPEGAETIERRGKTMARWTNGKGQERMAKVLDDGRVQFVSDCWYVRYTDASGKMRRESSGCRDKRAAERALADILGNVEKVKVGVISPAEIAAVGHLDTPLTKHTAHYLADLAARNVRGRRVSPKHVKHVREGLTRIISECGFSTLRDIDRRTVQRWMDKKATSPRNPDDPDSEPLSARTINMHRSAIVAFCNWCVAEGRLTANPLTDLSKAEEAEPARKRRPLTENEIARLLKATQERPLRDALTIRRGKNKGKLLAKLSDQERQRLGRIGQERALVYKFMMFTGLRRGEAASLTVGALFLDETAPYIRVEGKHAKSGRAATLPLRADLADDLRRHIERSAKADDGRVPLDAPLFEIDWRNLLRTFNLDLAAAGIPKRDAQGRTVDVHCLRHTFATLLARNGVSPGIAQKLMRHSDIRLTMNTYTHLDLADTASAVASLPAI